MNCVLFTDKIKMTLGRPAGRVNGGVYFGGESHHDLQCQQRVGRVMLWAGVIGDRLVGPIKVPKRFKVTAAT